MIKDTVLGEKKQTVIVLRPGDFEKSASAPGPTVASRSPFSEAFLSVNDCP